MQGGGLGLGKIAACPACQASLDHGFVGTNGRVFWSKEEHLIGLFGDANLIPISLATTTYLPTAKRPSCGLVMFQPSE
jgi:hypothetical protein